MSVPHPVPAAAPDATPVPLSLPRFGDAIASLLWDLGVRQAYGLTGGAIGPLCESLDRSPIQVVHCRHEGGAAFAATEASFASNRPVALFATTGPGLTNALTGLHAARWEGARVVVVSGATSAAQRGRWATQETSAYTSPAGLYSTGEVFDFAHVLEHPAEFEVVAARLAAGFARPGGFVAHVVIPISMQMQTVTPTKVPLARATLPTCSAAELDDLASELVDSEVMLWVGYGARHASDEVRALAERLGCPVISSPRAKGIFPETHPQFLGVTGLGGSANVDQYLAERRPEYMLVLGTRMGEPTSFWEKSFIPSKAFIHVDVDPAVFGRAYPTARTIAVHSEIREFTRGLLRRIEPRGRLRPVVRKSVEAPLAPREGQIRPRFVLEAMQRVIVDGSDAVVLTESGNSFAWGNHTLRFDAPHRYRVSVGYGSMGHVTAGVVGTALARGGKAVALVGDGSMLMNSEVSTAVQYGAQAVWVVLNDSLYGMVDAGMRAQGFKPTETQIPLADFSMIARGMGADGCVVTREEDVDAALREAMAAPGPWVVDVRVDPSEPGPWLKRIQNLILQGAKGTGSGT